MKNTYTGRVALALAALGVAAAGGGQAEEGGRVLRRQLHLHLRHRRRSHLLIESKGTPACDLVSLIAGGGGLPFADRVARVDQLATIGPVHPRGRRRVDKAPPAPFC